MSNFHYTQYEPTALHSFSVVLLSKLESILNKLPVAKEKPSAIDSKILEDISAYARACDAAQMRVWSQSLDMISRLGGLISADPAKRPIWLLFRELLQSIITMLRNNIKYQVNKPIMFTRQILQARELLKIPNRDTESAVAATLFMPYIPQLIREKQEKDIKKYNESLIENVRQYKALKTQYQLQAHKDTLQKMRQALVSLEFRNTYIGYNLFFDASIAFFDYLIQNSSEYYPDYYKWLIGSIEQCLDKLLGGDDGAAPDRVISALLYTIATPYVERSARILRLNQELHLDLHYTETWELTEAVKHKYLRAIEITATKLEDYCNKTSDALDFNVLLDCFIEFKEHAPKQPIESIRRLADALVPFMNSFQELEQRDSETQLSRRLVLTVLQEMMRQLEDGEDPERAEQLLNQMQLTLDGNIDQLEVSGGAKQLWVEALLSLLNECKKRYSQSENAFNAWCDNDDNSQQELVIKPLIEIKKGLAILSKTEPSEVFAYCISYLSKGFESEVDQKVLSSRLVSAGELLTHLSTMEDYGYQISDQLLRTWKEIDRPIVKELTEFSDTPSDNEKDFFPVYIEELSRVMETFNKTLPDLNQEPFDPEDSEHPLVTFRRAWHTLKGTSNMIGLKRIGEAAFIIENYLNKVLRTERRLLTPNEITWIAGRVNDVDRWYHALQKTQIAEVKFDLFTFTGDINSVEEKPVVFEKESLNTISDDIDDIIETENVYEKTLELPVLVTEVKNIESEVKTKIELAEPSDDSVFLKTLAAKPAPVYSEKFLKVLRNFEQVVAEDISIVKAEGESEIDAPDTVVDLMEIPVLSDDVTLTQNQDIAVPVPVYVETPLPVVNLVRADAVQVVIKPNRQTTINRTRIQPKKLVIEPKVVVKESLLTRFVKYFKDFF